MFPHHPGGQGQLPSHWNSQPPTSSQPTNGTYPPHSHITTSLPPPPAEPRPDMAALQPQPPYRLPAPHEWTRGPPPPDPYRPGPPHMAYAQQPAPRQRTAIACRYCRRRKIRCSGFEASDDGRCTNCVRFAQECIFTPVSAQTQAFVPAHTVWRGGGQAPPTLYGAYGQPLPPASHQHQQDAYVPPPPRQQVYPLPSPTGPYSTSASGPGPVYASPLGGAYDDWSSRDAHNSRKRPIAEPHTPTLPPPNPASASQLPAHRGPGPDYTYPDPAALTSAAVSPASSSASYHSAPPPQAQPYYSAQPPRRSSPQSAYSYDPSRTSSSPNTQGAPSTPGSTPYPAFPADTALRPLPVRSEGRTPPPPTSQPSSRPGMRITDIVSGDIERSSTDSNMLNALNRRPM